ncbi:Autoinducer 2 sensor kinase/phosphatase LuxQ [Rosistilla carotiformis]|uniref:histidine kinase n=1 Tax=Rosistilla carotiformis TaxID=2528017 RepID=A0A518JR24_9BACT|nr:PAS domain S-box protein [Rosistilla carotiformis]QDV67992.1 Autoinducer 2 sensor kinase/phosphatase LuxQ [Rosistilla carotiformis]
MSDRSHWTPLVVGVGISQAGILAFEAFLDGLGDAFDIAIVVNQAAEANGVWLSTDRLRRHTSLPVVEVVQQVLLKPGCLYIAAPEVVLELRGNMLAIADPQRPLKATDPIDHLFDSIAQQRGEYGVGGIVSGSGQWGTIGLQSIDDAGGMTFAFDTQSVSGAIKSVVDVVMPAAKIAGVIRKHAARWKRIAPLQREQSVGDHKTETAQCGSCDGDDHAPRDGKAESGCQRIEPCQVDPTSLLESTNLAILFLDNDFRIRSFTPGVTSLYPLTTSDIGNPLETVTHNAIEMPSIQEAASRVANGPVEEEVETQDGRWFLRRVQTYRNTTPRDGGFVVTFYEITEQHRLRMRLAAAHGVTKLLADAESFETVIPKVLEALRVSLSAEVCSLWRIDEQGKFLTCVETDVNDSSLQPFVEVSRNTRLALGEGLPGQAWNDREPVWVEDVQNTAGIVRSVAARACELTSAVATPIIVGRKFKGVIEIFTARQLTREPELLQLLGAVGYEIGQFIRQRRLSDTIRDEEARKSAILESAIDCVITMDTHGRIVDFNPAAERTFGYAASEVVGRVLSEVVIPEAFREAHENGLARFLQTGQSSLMGQRVELTAQRADGSLFPIELAMSVSLGRDGLPFFTGYLRDITDRKHAEAILHERAELAALHASLAVSLAGEAPLCEILNTCCQRIVEGLDAAFARVWLLNEQEQVLYLTASAGMYTHLDGSHARIPMGQWKIGRIAATQEPLLSNDVANESNISDPQWASREGMVAFAGLPLVVEHRVVGVMALFAKHTLAKEGFEQLMPMADAIAQCIARKESEQQLLDREQRLNLALGAGRLGTWHWDVGADRVTWSDQLYEIFGFAKEEFQATRDSFLQIVHIDDRAYVTQKLEAIFTGNCRAYEMDFRITRGDDQRTIWTSGRGVIVRDAFNHPLSITAVASDITDRKHWELELSDRESHLRSVIDHTLFFIGVLDVDGTLLEANAVAIHAGGVDRSQVIGRKFWDCYWWNFGQESIEKLQDAVRQAATGKVVRYDVEARMAGDTRMTIDFMISPVRASDGSISYLIPSGVDISERRAVEAAVIEREQFLTLALDAGKMGSFKWDIQTQRVEWSEMVYTMYGCRPDQFDGTVTSCWQLIHPEDREFVKAEAEKELASPSDDHLVEFRLIRPQDGRTIWVESRGVIHRDPHGNPLHVTGLLQDISARKIDELSLAFLSDLQTQLMPVTAVSELMAVSTRMIAQHLGLSRCMFVEFDAHGETADILCDHRNGDQPSMVGRHAVRAFHDEAERAALLAGQQVLSSDIRSPQRSVQLTDNFRAFNVAAFCNSAYVTDRGAMFVISAVHAEQHTWQTDERRLLQEVAERVGLRIERARSEEELANREAHLRRVINNQLGLVGVIDRNGILLEVDDRSLKIAHTRREEVVGKHFAEAPWWSYDPAVAAKMRETMQRAMQGEVVRYDVSLFAHGDEGVMIDFMIAPVTDANGEVEYLIPSGVDIRDRYRAQQQLMDNERRVSMALRAGRMAAWEWTPEKSHWDPQLFELLGVPPATSPSPEYFFECVHPDDLPMLQATWKRATDGEDDYDAEFRIRLPDGSIRWLAAVGTVIRDHDGTVAAMHGLNWDITEQKETQERIRDSEQRFRNMANAAPAMIWVTDPNHHCTFLSQRWSDYTGQPALEGLEFGWLETLHPDDQQPARDAFLAAAEKYESFELDFRLRCADGSYRWAIDAGQPRFDESGGFVGYVGSVIDAHDRHEAQAALQEARAVAVAANESKSAFLANMSHEIRTPMTAILGYTELLADLVEDEEAKRHLQTIRHNGDYLLDIINDILDLSKIEAGKLDVECERFDPHRLIEDVRSIMEVRAQEEKLKLTVTYDGKLPKLISSDAKRLKQILINLVGNAIKFTLEGRVEIRVRFEAASERLRFDVIDTGIGIPAEQMDTLFKPFYQGDASVTRNFGGTGLGLAISQRLAEMLGDTISARSTVGVGSTFTVRVATGKIVDSDLVDYDPIDRALETGTTVDADAMHALTCHVLIVDDRRDIRFLSRHILTQSGATVDECEDGLVAVEYITQCLTNGDSPDLILLDMQMPKLDGYSTAKEIRALGYSGPIIALTADAMQGDMNKCLEAGCNDYLSKPIDRSIMLQKIAEMLA